MSKTDLTFDVHMVVPLKSLETIVGFANDLDCGILAAKPRIRTRTLTAAAAKPANFAKMAAAHPQGVVEGSIANAKAIILERLRTEKMPVSRKTLMRELRSKGFARNSIGPICTEMKRAGQIANPRRGYWTMPDMRDDQKVVEAFIGA